MPKPTRRPRRSTPAAPLSAHSLLRLMWLASPALPVGGFSYSEGLESAIEAGHVVDDVSTSRWLCDQLYLSLARSDLAVASKAFDAWQKTDLAAIDELNHWVTTTRETREMRLQTEQMGRSLGAWLVQQCGQDDRRVNALLSQRPAPTWPVAFALAAVCTGAPLREAMLALAFGWAENMVQAALKSVPLGQAAGQRVLTALTNAIPDAVDRAMALPTSGRQAMTPMLAILSARHEEQYSRLFRS